MAIVTLYSERGESTLPDLHSSQFSTYCWIKGLKDIAMNLVYLSPHFPDHYYHFCKNLKQLGANVLGIGDAPLLRA